MPALSVSGFTRWDVRSSTDLHAWICWALYPSHALSPMHIKVSASRQRPPAHAGGKRSHTHPLPAAPQLYINTADKSAPSQRRNAPFVEVVLAPFSTDIATANCIIATCCSPQQPASSSVAESLHADAWPRSYPAEPPPSPSRCQELYSHHPGPWEERCLCWQEEVREGMLKVKSLIFLTRSKLPLYSLTFCSNSKAPEQPLALLLVVQLTSCSGSE